MQQNQPVAPHDPSQGESSTTRSNQSSPSSYTLSDTGGDDFGHTISTTAAAAAAADMSVMQSAGSGISYRHIPYPLPSVYVSNPPMNSLYSQPSSHLGQQRNTGYTHLPHPRPRQSSRSHSFGYSPSRSHSRSLSPSPASSPAGRHASLNAVAGASSPLSFSSSSIGTSGTGNPYFFPPPPPPQQQQQQQQQPQSPMFLAPVSAMSPPVVRFPSQSLPSHPALVQFQSPYRPGWAERLSQRTVDRLIQPYRMDMGTTLGLPAPVYPVRILDAFPQRILNRIWSELPYRELISLRALSRKAQDTVDPQQADRDDKYAFVREREDRLAERSRKRGGGGELGALREAACFFCFTVKSTRNFQAPAEQKHWAIVHVDPHTGEVSYTPCEDEEPTQLAPSRNPSWPNLVADDVVSGGATSFGCWQGQHAAFGQQHQVQHQHHQQFLPGSGHSHDPSLQNRARSLTPADGTRISLRRYCIECGVRHKLHVPGELIKCWARDRPNGSDRKVWICECDLPPRDRIHDQASVDMCNRCNARASYR